MLLHLMSCCIDAGQNSIAIPLELKLADFKLHILVHYGKTLLPLISNMKHSTDKFGELRAD